MFDFLPKGRFLLKREHSKKSILEDEKFRPEPDYKDLHTEEEVKNTEHMRNYLRRPYARGGKYAFCLSLVALLLGYIAVRITIALKGNPELYVSAIVCSAIIFALCSLYYVYRGFREREVKYLLNYLALLSSGTQLILWLIIIIVGGRA